jgi:hypothetical protein
LLVADGGDERHRAGRDRADEALVAERQEVFEAAAAASQDDDVDLRGGAELLERFDHRHRGAWPLDVGLRDKHARGREAAGDRGDDVAFRRRVVSGQEPDPARQARQRTLALRVEETFGAELALESLEGSEVVAQAEPFDG